MRRIFTCAVWLVITLCHISAMAQETKPVVLNVFEKTITVDGKNSKVFAIEQPDGTFGYKGVQGQDFFVLVKNNTPVPIALHWHGLVDPNMEDGVPYVTQLPIPPAGSYEYRFKLKQAGTFWLHSHYKLQEQKLMAAPLIIYNPNERTEPEAIMFLQDFSFSDPKSIYAALRSKMAMPMKHDKSMDVTDVKFDAYLTNHRTLKNPDIIRVTSGDTMRLRIINASASSNYYIDLGQLHGELIAVDGAAIKPIEGSRFQIAIGNRLDIRVSIPDGEGAYPILALPEGTRQQSGLILATSHASIPVVAETTTDVNPTLNYQQEYKMVPDVAVSNEPATQSFPFVLNGSMSNYVWTINGKAWPDIKATIIKPRKRTELEFINKSGMSHPMHLHGHVFQVTEINGKRINGRLGDTINVMPRSSVKVVFDADNPGIWMLHCHILYHQQGGMMTTVNYAGYPVRFSERQQKAGDMLSPS